MPALQQLILDLPKALVWLRLVERRKQHEVADGADLTQAMLCSYEKGKRVPSLLSLARTLDSLNVGFAELERVLRLVHKGSPDTGEPVVPPPKRRRVTAPVTELSSEDLAALVGSDQPLEPREEEALRKVLVAFRR